MRLRRLAGFGLKKATEEKTNAVRGAIGENLVLRKLGKQTVFSRRAVVKKPKSEEQMATFNRFVEATLFAVSELRKPDAGLMYKIMAELQGANAHHGFIARQKKS